jgi:hypothetical protein
MHADKEHGELSITVPSLCIVLAWYVSGSEAAYPAGCP